MIFFRFRLTGQIHAKNNMNAVERVYQYSNERTIPQEPAYEDTDETTVVPSAWPSQGQIEFDNVFMR